MEVVVACECSRDRTGGTRSASLVERNLIVAGCRVLVRHITSRMRVVVAVHRAIGMFMQQTCACVTGIEASRPLLSKPKVQHLSAVRVSVRSFHSCLPPISAIEKVEEERRTQERRDRSDR